LERGVFAGSGHAKEKGLNALSLLFEY